MLLPQNRWNEENVVRVIKNNGVVVMPTDTLYGIVGKAETEEVVNRIYAARKRNPEKPCIILIGDVNELEKFSIVLSEKQKISIKEYWSLDLTQGLRSLPMSIVLDCEDEELKYLHRGTKTLAFRLPNQKDLRDLLLKTGPLIAPSANIEGLPPAKNIDEAKKYFGDLVDPVRSRSPQGDRSTRFARAASNGVDMYIDGGEITNKASKVIKLNKDGLVEVLRA